MKKIIYFLFLLVFVVGFSSCNEEDYKNINITNYEEPIDIKEFVGDMTAQIVVKNPDGINVTDVDMGSTFYVIDNTDGGASERVWTITQNGQTITSAEQLVRLNFTKPGMATISLTSKRSSDGTSVTSQTSVVVNKVPLSSDFSSVPEAVNGVTTITAGESIQFKGLVSGSPTVFDWVIEGPETLTSSEQNPTIRFTKSGDYNVKFTIRRDDGEEGISELVVEKTAYVKVNELIVNYLYTESIGNKLLVHFDHPMADPTANLSQISASITSNAGSVIPVQVLSAKVSTSKNNIELTIDATVYSDDKAYITIGGDKLMDETGLATIKAVNNDVVIYGKALFADGFDNEDWYSGSASLSGIWNYDYTNVYQGRCSVHMNKSSNSVAVASRRSFALTTGMTIIIEYQVKKTVASGGFETRFTTTNDGNGNIGATVGGGHWTNAGNFSATSTWGTVKQTYTMTASYPTVYMFFLFYGSGDVWVDNFRIYTANPRP